MVSGAKDRTKDDDDDLDKVEQDNKDQVEKYKRRCNRIARAAIQLVPKPKTATALSKLVRESQASSIEDKNKVVINIYACGRSGECVTNPSTRRPPLRQQYKDCMQAMLESREDPRELHPRDIDVTLDGGKHGAAVIENQQHRLHEQQQQPTDKRPLWQLRRRPLRAPAVAAEAAPVARARCGSRGGARCVRPLWQQRLRPLYAPVATAEPAPVCVFSN